MDATTVVLGWAALVVVSILILWFDPEFPFRLEDSKSMGQVSKVLRKIDGGYSHWCPGCESMHMIATDEPWPNGAQWSFDGNVERPTFGPSVRIKGIKHDHKTGEAERDKDGKPIPSCCHYFIRAGRIDFCGDSTHALAGKTMDLPPLPAALTDS